MSHLSPASVAKAVRPKLSSIPQNQQSAPGSHSGSDAEIVQNAVS
jgi:hypothetical protein